MRLSKSPDVALALSLSLPLLQTGKTPKVPPAALRRKEPSVVTETTPDRMQSPRPLPPPRPRRIGSRRRGRIAASFDLVGTPTMKLLRPVGHAEDNLRSASFCFDMTDRLRECSVVLVLGRKMQRGPRFRRCFVCCFCSQQYFHGAVGSK
ncbi:hypothetical protein BC567DRAFT_238698 [Phyllosticta citribraziliensis]